MTVEFLEMTCPSDALNEMVHGLLTLPRKQGFLVDMGTFGTSHSRVCFGCAATATLFTASGQPVDNALSSVGRTSAYDRCMLWYDVEDYHRLCDLEQALDYARAGTLRPLFGFFEMARYHEPSFDGRFELENHNYRRNLHLVQELADELEMWGL